MEKEQQNKVTYMVYCISAFAKSFGLSGRQAYNYLHRFKAIAFLNDCYEAEHQLSIENAVSDMATICRNNGGALA